MIVLNGVSSTLSE